MLPDFLGIGVQRAGTTFVHEALSDHPEICTPDEKEVHFFDWHFDRGLDWYKEQFEACTEDQVVGEVTPDYIASEEALDRIHQTVPEAKLFVILRDPVERAYSAYWLFKAKRYPDRSFEQAIEDDPELVERGMYADQLRAVFDCFDADQVKIDFLAGMKDDDLAFVQDLYAFLDVEETFEPKTAGESHNALVFPRIQNVLRRAHLLWIKDIVKAVGLDRPIRRWHRDSSGSSYPPMEPGTEVRLRERFRPHDERLQALLGRPLPWRDQGATSEASEPGAKPGPQEPPR